VKSVEKYGRQGRDYVSTSEVPNVSTNFHDTLARQLFVAKLVPNLMKIRDGLVAGIASKTDRRVDEVFS
jgi:hypothetical protein